MYCDYRYFASYINFSLYPCLAQYSYQSRMATIIGILLQKIRQYNVTKRKRKEILMISFDPWRRTMKEKQITLYALTVKYGMSKRLVDKFKHNQNVTLETLERMCDILDCRIEDIVEFKKDTP